MADDKMTPEEANKIQFRKIDIEKFKASIPAVHAEMDRLQEAADQCTAIRLRYRN